MFDFMKKFRKKSAAPQVVSWPEARQRSPEKDYKELKLDAEIISDLIEIIQNNNLGRFNNDMKILIISLKELNVYFKKRKKFEAIDKKIMKCQDYINRYVQKESFPAFIANIAKIKKRISKHYYIYQDEEKVLFDDIREIIAPHYANPMELERMMWALDNIHKEIKRLIRLQEIKNNLASKEKISSAKQEKIIAKIDKDFKKHLMRITANYLYTLEAKAEKLDMVRIRTVVDSVHGRMIRLMKGMLKSQNIKTEMQFSFS